MHSRNTLETRVKSYADQKTHLPRDLVIMITQLGNTSGNTLQVIHTYNSAEKAVG